jgi:hypothetical protein
MGATSSSPVQATAVALTEASSTRRPQRLRLCQQAQPDHGELLSLFPPSILPYRTGVRGSAVAMAGALVTGVFHRAGVRGSTVAMAVLAEVS